MLYVRAKYFRHFAFSAWPWSSCEIGLFPADFRKQCRRLMRGHIVLVRQHGFRYIAKLPLSQGQQGRARHSVRAADSNPLAERRARSDAPYLTYIEICLLRYQWHGRPAREFLVWSKRAERPVCFRKSPSWREQKLTGGTPVPLSGGENSSKTSRIEPLNRSRRRESALILCLESKHVRRLTSAATRVHGKPPFVFPHAFGPEPHWHPSPRKAGRGWPKAGRGAVHGAGPNA